MKTFKYLIISSLLLFGLLLSSCNDNNVNQKNEYEIAYYDGDTFLEYEYVLEGENAVGIDTFKAGYEFKGWDTELTNIQSDLVVHGTWEKSVYLVQFFDGDKLIKKVECGCNESVTPPKVSKEYGYTLSWNISFDEITENTNVYLVRTKLVFNVRFYGFDNEVVSEQQVLYLESAEEPTILNDNYILTGWDQDYECITEDIDIYPIYHKVYASITYMLGDNVLDLAPATYKVGEEVELPKLFNDDAYFSYWCLDSRLNSRIDKINANSTADLVLYAKVVYKERQNRIILNENVEGHFIAVNCNNDCWQPQLPITDSVQNYDWSTSDSSVATISTWSSISIHSSGYCIVQACHKTTKKIYNAVIKTTINGVYLSSEEEANTVDLIKVTFVGKDDEVIEEQYVEKNGSVIAPSPMIYNGYRFDGWDHELYNITSNVTIKGNYVIGNDKYSGKYISIIGDSISTYQDNIPSGYATFYPYPVADVNDVNMTWSSQVVNHLGGKLLSNNSYSGSMVDGSATYQAKHLERLKECAKQGVSPDVIIIYMGSNDASTASVQTFTKAYTEMIDNIYKLYPNVEIILCDLPESKYYNSTKQQTINDVIQNMANQYQLKLIKLHEVSIKDTLVDSAHPKYNGMKIIADKIISEIYK